MIVTEGWLGPLPRSDIPLQATYTLEPCQTSMVCHQKCSQFFIKSRTSHPDKNQYICSMLQWGTVLTNDCYRRLIGSITKVWHPFTKLHTHWGHARHQWCFIKNLVKKFQIRNFFSQSEWTYMQHVAMKHTVLTNDCYRRLIGSITKVWQPFTSYIHTGTMPDINDVSSKM